MEVISGGQNGVDIAALRAAKAVGLKTGGFLPKGCKTLDGPRYDYIEEYGMIETELDYKGRTWKNVEKADATIRIASDFKSAGEKCTFSAIKFFKKPYYDINIFPVNRYDCTSGVRDIIDWLITNNVNILNVAGNSEKTSRGIYATTFPFLVRVFTEWKK